MAQPSLVNAYEDDALAGLWKERPANVTFSIESSLPGNDDIRFEDIAGGNLFHRRREYEDGQLPLLSNTDTAGYVRGTAAIVGAGLKELEPITGKTYLYPSSKTADGKEAYAKCG